MNTQTLREPVDVAIVGGGLVGLAAALALADEAAGAGLRVVLIDRNPLSVWDDITFDGRASAITATSRRMLDMLGVWAAVAEHAQPMTDIVVTDSRPGAAARPTLLRFDTGTGAGEPASHMVENRHMGQALAGRVSAEPGIAVLAPDRVLSTDRTGARASLTLESGATIAATLIVGADGRHSPLREAAGITSVGWDYGQSGIVTTVAHEKPHGGVAEEHFMPAGPFAILPLTGNRSSLVWTEATPEAKRIVDLDDRGFTAELMRRFGDHLGAARPVGPRWAWPLAMHLARDMAADRLVLVGDAAHVIHPLAGLGLNLGLRDCAALAEIVGEAARLGLDIGNRAALGRYEQWRRPDTVATALAMDGLNRLFSNDNPVLKAVRDLGLGMVDRIEPLKGLFVSEAAGLTGTLPRLMRGETV
jgi:2-octaprenyl-6-methoxyphenol hydroxylase